MIGLGVRPRAESLFHQMVSTPRTMAVIEAPAPDSPTTKAPIFPPRLVGNRLIRE